MSVDDSSRLASSPPPTDDPDKVQPTVRDALIGADIGLLLIYAGTYISNWILRWLVIGEAEQQATRYETLSPDRRRISGRALRESGAKFKNCRYSLKSDSFCLAFGAPKEMLRYLRAPNALRGERENP